MPLRKDKFKTRETLGKNTWKKMRKEEKEKILRGFANKMIKQSIDIDKNIQKIIDKDPWDLLA